MAAGNVKLLTSRGVVVLIVFFVAFITFAARVEAKPRALFGEAQGQVVSVGASGPSRVGGGSRSAEMRSRGVKIDMSAIAGADSPEGADGIDLNLFADRRLAAVKSRFERRDQKHFTWFGKVSDDPVSSVVLVAGDGQVQGHVFAHGKHYSVQGADAASQEVVEIDQSAFPRENCDQAPAGDTAAAEPAITTSTGAVADTGTTIDVLVVYTPAARIAANRSMPDFAQLAIDTTNASYANSLITPRLRLVRAQEISYTESGNWTTDLSRLSGTSDGYMDSVHAIRDTYRADVVVLLIKDQTYCGLAYLPATAATAFSLVAWDCAVSNYSFGHEIGHLQGARHDLYVDPIDGPVYAYNHGDVDTVLQQRTVMAYNNKCADSGFYCTRLGYWSNPNVPYPGTTRPTGSIADENNAQVLSNTAYAVANFRQASVPTAGLTVQSTYPSSGVTITASPADKGGVTSGVTAFALTYNLNASVTLTAPATAPVPGRVDTFPFSAWSGCTSTSGPGGTICAVTMNGNKTVTANYVPDNYLPTLNAIADVTINEDAGLQTISLSGISPGPPSESGQTFSVSAASSNPDLIPDPPTVSYSTASTGSVSFTPVANANGTATITVTVVDDGPAPYNTFSRAFLVTVRAVNDAPSFSMGADPTVGEDPVPAAQSVSGWATSISAGPDNESTQTLSFVTTNGNHSLFAVQPAVAANGTLTFKPAANANGNALVTVQLRDNGGTANGGADTSDPQTFTITVTAVNDAPSFVKGANKTVSEDVGAQTVANWATSIRAGPANESAQALNFIITDNNNADLFGVQPAVAANGTLTFTPNADANGSATVTVQLHDDGGTADGGVDTSGSQTFTITVIPVNDAPTLNAIDYRTIDEDAAEQTVGLTGISAGVGESQPLTVTAVSSNTALIPKPTVNYTSPATAGELRFTPVANAYGTATITVTVKDGQALRNTVTRSFVVTVTPVNDPPTLNAIADVAVKENAGLRVVALGGITAGPKESQKLTVTAESSNSGLIPNPVQVVYTSPGTTGSLRFTPVTNMYGTATITVTVNDGQPTSNTAVRSFVVTVNNPPTLNAIPNLTIMEDAAEQTVFLSGITAGPGEGSQGPSLFVDAVSSNVGLIPKPTVTYTPGEATGSLRFTPVADAKGTATITVTVNDGQVANNTVVRTFLVTVNSVNDEPSFVKGADKTVPEDAGSQSIPVWATGISAGPGNESTQTLSFVTTNDNHPLFAVQPAVAANGTLTFRPALNANGGAVVTVYVRDNGGTTYGGKNASDPQTFTITVLAVNDAPSFVRGGNRTVLEDAAAQTAANWATSIRAGPTNESAQPLVFIVTDNNNADLFSVQPAVAANGTLTFTPKADASGSARVTLQLHDLGGTENGGVDTSGTQWFTITVIPLNDAPTLGEVANRTIDEDAAEQIVGLNGISAGGGEIQPLTVTAVSSSTGLIPKPTVAYTSPAETGELRFTPVANAYGTATITVTVKDGQTLRNTVTRSFVVTVNPVNDAPMFTKGADPTVVQDSGAKSVPGWAKGINAGAPNESAQILTFVVTNDNNALFTAQPAVTRTGTLTYTPSPGVVGSATAQIVLKDNGGTANGGIDTSAPQSFTITVSPATLADALNLPVAALSDAAGAENIQTATSSFEFQDALTVARTNGKHDVIRLAGGTYTLSGNGNEPFVYSSTENKDLTIEGGWTTDFSQKAANIPTELRSDLPAAISGSGGVLGITAVGNVNLAGLTVSGGNTEGNGGGLFIRTDGSIVVGNCQILGNSSGGDGGGLYLDSAGGNVRLYGSTIKGNSGSGGGGGVVKAPSISVYGNEISGNAAAVADGGLRASVVSGGVLVVSTNTIYGNTAPAGSSGLSVSATGSRGMSVLDIYNNIVYGNGAAPNFVVAPDSDCVMNYLDLNIVNNDIACYEMCPEYLLDGSNFSVDFSGRGAGSIRLTAADTALIDHGSPYTAPLEDIDGDAIPLDGHQGAGAVPDIGADEYNPENVAGPTAMVLSASGTITSPGGDATITVTLDKPAKRDLVLYLAGSDADVATVSSHYLGIPKGLDSAQTVVKATSGGLSGVSVITVTDPSGRIAPGRVPVTIQIND